MAPPVRNQIQVIERILDDVSPIGIVIQDNTGAAIDITSRTFTVDVIKMSDNSVAATAIATTKTDAANGKLSFTPSAAAVDEAGEFAIYAIDDSGRYFPYDGARLQLHVKAAGAT